MPDTLDDLAETPVERRSRRRRRRRWPWVVLAVFIALVALGAVAASFGYTFYKQAESVRSDLLSAKNQFAAIPALVKEGDTDKLDAVAANVLTLTTRADSTVQGDLWEIAARIPVVGQNVAALRGATEATHILVRDALPLGVELMATLQPEKIKLEGGGFDLAPFEGAQEKLPQINEAFTAAQAQVADIDRRALLSFVDDAIGQLLDVIDEAGPALAEVEHVLPTLLNVAGAQDERTYLVIFQNNAEIRATGGNPAASMILTVDNGKVEMLDQASSATFYAAGTQYGVYTDLPEDTLKLYLSTFDSSSQDFTMSPDFPTTARLFQNLFKATTGDTFDGVISIDPVVLAEALKVAGPLGLPGGETITGDNAVQVLLSDAYARYPRGEDSDRFFAEVASAAFNHLMSPTWDPVAMLEALEGAADAQRVYLSFAAEEEQALVVEYGLDGALREDNETATQLGIYLNDYSVGKLEYYLSTVMTATCSEDDRTVTVALTMKNSVPDGSLQRYVTGLRNGTYGYSNRAMLLDVLFFAPPGATIIETDPSEGDIAAFTRSGVEKGNTALSKLIAVGQGATRTVSYTVQLPDGDLGPLELRHTPTASETPVDVDASCGWLTSPAAEQ